MIRGGYLDAAITGGAEAPITPLGVGGFVAMRALSTRNEDPQAASRPFDLERDGFVIAEGAAALILEERESAIARGAKILAEIVGYATNSDAYHITSPSPEGQGAAKCMQRCLEDGDSEPGRSRLYQRAWDLDAAGRYGGDPGDQARLRRACRAYRGQFDQVDDRAHAGRGGCDRIGLHRSGDQTRPDSADYQSRISRPGVRSRLCAEYRAARRRSGWR